MRKLVPDYRLLVIYTFKYVFQYAIHSQISKLKRNSKPDAVPRFPTRQVDHPKYLPQNTCPKILAPKYLPQNSSSTGA